jgi:hypothetical protein
VTVVSDDRDEARHFAKRFIADFCHIARLQGKFCRLGFANAVELINKTYTRSGPEEAANVVPTDMAEKMIVFGSARECTA